MLDAKELDAAINGFILRKQKQFPDIRLSAHNTNKLTKALSAYSDEIGSHNKTMLT